HEGHGNHRANGREILERVVAQVLEQQGIDRDRAGVAHQQRVAIGLCLGHGTGSDHTVSTRLVFHNECGAHTFGQTVADDSCNGVDGAAGAEADDEAYGLVGVIGRRGGERRGGKGEGGSQRCQTGRETHVCLLLVCGPAYAALLFLYVSLDETYVLFYRKGYTCQYRAYLHTGVVWGVKLRLVRGLGGGGRQLRQRLFRTRMQGHGKTATRAAS